VANHDTVKQLLARSLYNQWSKTKYNEHLILKAYDLAQDLKTSLRKQIKLLDYQD
jgi:hypothetical protein